MRVLFGYGRLTVGFAWYDLWVGFYYDVDRRVLYFVPIPTLVFRFTFK